MKELELIKIPMPDLHAMREQGFDELQPYTHKNPLVRWVFWKRLETILSLASPAQRVLDFGAGSGIFMRSLAKSFPEVHCIDLWTQPLEYVKKKFSLANVTVTQTSGGALPYPDQYFDIVFAADVLEHFESRTEILREFKRILKPTGSVIISGPTENLLYVLARRLIFWFWQKKQDHFTDIKGIMQEASELFAIEKVRVLPSPLIPGFKIFNAKLRAQA